MHRNSSEPGRLPPFLTVPFDKPTSHGKGIPIKTSRTRNLVAALLALGVALATTVAQAAGYAGSVSCMECHEKFYQLWSTSYHGLAMQPYTAEFAKKSLMPQANDVKIGKFSYRADISGSTGWVRERGPGGEKKYRIEQALGGKNVYYFLTPMEKGRLQTLPVAYDVQKKEWFDTAASGIRHFPGGQAGQQLDWKDPAYTFNTSCHGCHVSQLSTNYNLVTDTYNTTWAEPGINCEACHGPSSDHNRVLRETPEGQKPVDLKIISWKNFTPEQKNAACSICHAKMSPVTSTFTPGDRFFDHFDLAAMEDPDFYPDGRDLGEDYTYTSWMLSPCAKAGKLNCVTCHTSSGRYRFKAEEKANDVCMPCHEDHVKDATAHTHHQQGSAGNKCISCHMPTTSFARMNRTDHSMLPPAPASTIAYQSPNACNLCHTDKNAGWADKYVREWRTRDYQAPLLERASLIDGARKRGWSKLPEMLSYITNKGHDEIFATSLIRMVSSSGDPRVAPVLLEAMGILRPWCARQRPQPCKASPRKKPCRPSWKPREMTAAWFASGLPPPLQGTGTSPWEMHGRKPFRPQAKSTSPRSSPARTNGAPITIWATITWTETTSSRPLFPMTLR